MSNDTGLRTFLWTPSGYRLSTAKNWKQYDEVKDGLFIAHDAFEHQIDDTDGAFWREVRTLGGDFYFRSRLMHPDVWNILSKGEKLPHPFEDLSTYKISPSLKNHYSKFVAPELLDGVLNLMKHGHRHAKQFSIDSFNKVCAFDFKSAHIKSTDDLIIDLQTGDVRHYKEFTDFEETFVARLRINDLKAEREALKAKPRQRTERMRLAEIKKELLQLQTASKLIHKFI